MAISRKGTARSGEGRLILRDVKFLGKRPVLSIRIAKSWKMEKNDIDQSVRQIPVRIQMSCYVIEGQLEFSRRDTPWRKRFERRGKMISKLRWSKLTCLGFRIHIAAYSTAVFNKTTSCCYGKRKDLVMIVHCNDLQHENDIPCYMANVR